MRGSKRSAKFSREEERLGTKSIENILEMSTNYGRAGKRESKVGGTRPRIGASVNLTRGVGAKVPTRSGVVTRVWSTRV